jgi:type I restriction enzyme S subunit
MNWPTYPQYTSVGIAWLDKYPASWASTPLKLLATMRNGDSITSEAIEESGEYPVYGGNGLRGYTGSYTHQGERVLIGRQGALCGNIHLVSGKYWASEHAIVTTPERGVSSRWLAYVLEVMNLGQYSQAAAQPGIAADVIGKLRVPTPSSLEQESISDFLDRETAKIDALIRKQEQLIANHA